MHKPINADPIHWCTRPLQLTCSYDSAADVLLVGFTGSASPWVMNQHAEEVVFGSLHAIVDPQHWVIALLFLNASTTLHHSTMPC
jgi:hypothetical protein